MLYCTVVFPLGKYVMLFAKGSTGGSEQFKGGAPDGKYIPSPDLRGQYVKINKKRKHTDSYVVCWVAVVRVLVNTTVI